jgi:hypothetical protein
VWKGASRKTRGGRKKAGWSLGSEKDRLGRPGEGGRREDRVCEVERIV